MNKKFKIIIGIVVIILLLLIAGRKMGWFGKKGNFKQVTTEKVQLKEIIETVSATGKIYPEVEVSISSEVSGEIIELPIKEGNQVKKGDLLVKIKS
jgi:HlyD family secretion protein